MNPSDSPLVLLGELLVLTYSGDSSQGFIGTEPHPDSHYSNAVSTLILSYRTSEHDIFYNALLGD
jgi:hypothetical protein